MNTDQPNEKSMDAESSVPTIGKPVQEPVYPDSDDAVRRTAWMFEGKLGLTTHYSPAAVDKVDTCAERFDVEKVAEQCEAAGAKWFMLTLHHQHWLMQAPNEVLDQLTGHSGYTAKRDLIMDLHAALERRGICLMVYLNMRIDPESACQPEIQRALGPWPPTDENFRHAAAVFGCFAERYGDRVAGWWIDGVWIDAIKHQPVDRRERWFGMIAQALRAGNPEAALAFNPGVRDVFTRYSVHNDFLAGEANDLQPPPEERLFDGAQWHLWTYLGPWWGGGGRRYETAELCDWAQTVVRRGGVLSFEVGTRGIIKQGMHDKAPRREGPVGSIDPRQVEQVRAVADAIGAVAGQNERPCIDETQRR